MDWSCEAINAAYKIIAEENREPTRVSVVRAAIDAAIKAQGVYTSDKVARLCLQYRAEAFEEAAKVALDFTAPGHIEARDYGEYIAAAIRALAKETKG